MSTDDPYRTPDDPQHQPELGQQPEYGQAPPPPPVYGQQPYDQAPPPAYGQQPYGQQPPPVYGQTPYGGQPYGAPYNLPPSGYVPAPTPGPTGSTIALIVVSAIIVLTCYGIIIGAPSLIMSIIAASKASTDPAGAAHLTKIGWIVLGVLFGIAALAIGVGIAFAVSNG
ncbi:hypothetical protein [Luteipulveratus halotolerans]|uniref:DUF4190 domain-containing protein n=1 Tax=Luteipulveratus halotolerans TaxID=1631356 RepID=A0A0L6CFF1_9MICO|nr:hypothetical protein [Luteipulveratus halotolerans]KNX36263.1 hypothetical protein VV01_02485 [Luteipulveratus halotolerans]